MKKKRWPEVENHFWRQPLNVRTLTFDEKTAESWY